MHEKNDISGGFNKLATSKWYIPAVAATAFLFFITGLDLAGIVISATLFAAALLFTDNERYAMPPLLIMLFQLSFRHGGVDAVGYFSQPLAIMFFAVAVLIIAAAVIFYAVRIRPSRKRTFNLKKRKMLLPVIALAVVNVLGGLFHSPYDFSSLLYAFGVGIMFPAFYLGFAYMTDDSETTSIYLARTMVALMLTICAQLAAFYAFNFAEYGIMNSEWKGSMQIGWGMSNTIGAMLVMLIPAAYYLINKNINAGFNYTAVFAAINAVYFTMSRAALLIGVPMCIVLSVITFVNKRKLREKIGIMSAVFVLADILFALAVVLSDKITVFTEFFISNSVAGSGDIASASRGRTELWLGYFELFKSAPIFGVGFYNAFREFMSPTMTLFSGMAHNTIMQYLGSCGLVGIAGYAYHRYCSVKLYVKNYAYEKLMFAAGCAALILMSLFDVFFTVPYFALFYCIYIVLSENCPADPKKANDVNVISAYSAQAANVRKHKRKTGKSEK